GTAGDATLSFQPPVVQPLDVRPGEVAPGDRGLGVITPTIDAAAQDRVLNGLSLQGDRMGAGDTAPLTVAHQEAALRDHAAHLPPALRDQLLHDLDELKALNLGEEQLAGFLRNVNRLFEATPEQIHSPLERSDLVRTSLDLVNNAARTADTNQGSRNVCGVTGTIEDLLKENPRLASQIAADALLN